MIRNVTSKPDTCIGCGNCEQTCKAVFRLTYKAHAVPVGRDFEKHRKQLLAAYYACPVQAIELDSDEPDLQVTWISAQIIAKEMLSASVMTVRLKCEPVEYHAGQYVTVRFKDDIGYFNRAYSIVEVKDGIVCLCVTLVKGGRGSSFFVNYETGSQVDISVPKGEFVLKTTTGSKVFVGTGTGLAPLIAMMETCPDARKTVLFGQRNAADLFYLDRMARIPNLTVLTCLSGEAPDSRWTGLRGRVTDHFDKLPITRETEVYTCGSEGMMNELQLYLRKKRLPKKLFSRESFNVPMGPSISEAALVWRFWVRNTHIYASLAMSVLFLFFGFSGFLGSRPEMYPTSVKMTVPGNVSLEKAELAGYLKAQLPAGVEVTAFSKQDQTTTLTFENAAKDRYEVAVNQSNRTCNAVESHPLPDRPDLTNALQIAKNLNKIHHGHLSSDAVEEDGDKIGFTLESVWSSTTVEVDRAQKRYQLRKETSPWAMALVQLHRGKKSNPLQHVILDVTAILLILASLTGILMGLQARDPTIRLVASILVAVSTVMTVLMVIYR